MVAAMGCLALAAVSPARDMLEPAPSQGTPTASPGTAKPAAGQETAKPVAPQEGGRQMQSIRAALAAAKPARVNAVVMQFSGTFDDLPARFEEFTKTFESQGLAKRKLASNPTGIYVVYEDPEGKSSYKLAVGVQVPTKLDVKEPLMLETYAQERAARLAHVGPYKELGNVRNALIKQARSSALAKSPRGGGEGATFPVIARLLNDPRKVPERERRTELIIPF
jgi:hypothetical protein